MVSRIQPESKLVTLQVRGALTLADFVSGLDAMYDHPRFDPAMDVLVLIDPGAAGGLSSLEISGVVDALRERRSRRGHGRTALVAGDAGDAGLVDLLGRLLHDDPRPMRVFAERDAALAWLGQGAARGGSH